MQESVNYIELEQAVQRIEDLTVKVKTSLETIDKVIEENINSGVGIRDSASAEHYKERWQKEREEFPKIIEIFTHQSKNLQAYLKNMQNVE